jgi:hypothetical protein
MEGQEEEEPTGVDAMCEKLSREVVCAGAAKDERRSPRGMIGGQEIQRFRPQGIVAERRTSQGEEVDEN